mmetsp:Transcript_43491/g.94751  ORF Transcript_43491/g.94751 Transcript_43491/m.94751 type:complete len:179 (+) Transcript_43491:260-796(+)
MGLDETLPLHSTNQQNQQQDNKNRNKNKNNDHQAETISHTQLEQTPKDMRDSTFVNLDQSLHPTEYNKLNSSQIEYERKIKSKVETINDYSPMEHPWQGRVDSFARSLVKTKVRVRKVTVESQDTVTEKESKINKSLLSVQSLRTSAKNSKKDFMNTTKAIIKEEKEVVPIAVEPHNK